MASALNRYLSMNRRPALSGIVLPTTFRAARFGAVSRLPQTAAAPDATEPEGPILPEGGADPYAAFLRRRKRSGRAQTILTGSLSPTDIGKRTLLG